MLVLDDGSSDATAEILEPYSRVLPLTIVRQPERRGYAAAVQTLFRTALELTDRPKRDAAILMHADFTHNPQVIPDGAPDRERRRSGHRRRQAGGRALAPHRMLRRFAPQLLRGVVEVPGVHDLVSGFAIASAGRAPKRDAEPSERLPGDRRLGGERGALLADGTLRPPGGSGSVGRAARSPPAPQPHSAGGRGAQPLAGTVPVPRHPHCTPGGAVGARHRASGRGGVLVIGPLMLLAGLLQGSTPAPPSSPPDYPFMVGETLTYSAKLGMLTLGSAACRWRASIRSGAWRPSGYGSGFRGGRSSTRSTTSWSRTWRRTDSSRTGSSRTSWRTTSRSTAVSRSSPTPVLPGKREGHDLRQPRGPAGRRGLLLFHPDHAARSGQEVRVRPVLQEGEEPGRHRGGEARTDGAPRREQGAVPGAPPGDRHQGTVPSAPTLASGSRTTSDGSRCRSGPSSPSAPSRCD